MLYVVATPIGNLDDTTYRAIEVFRQADVLACEDTRRTRILLDRHGIRTSARMISYREQTEERAGEGLMRLMEAGQSVALCSDGGCPGISDPGYRLVALAIERGVEVQVIPGASAVHTALLMSGLPTSSYTFKGYPPRKAGALRRFFEQEKELPHTLVVFESPMRTAATLAAAMEALGDRKAAVCIEMTKKFERAHRGFLGDLRGEFAEKTIQGEVTLVIAGNNPKFLRERADSGESTHG